MDHIQGVCGSFDPIRYSEGQFYGDATFENPRVCESMRQKHLAQLWHSGLCQIRIEMKNA